MLVKKEKLGGTERQKVTEDRKRGPSQMLKNPDLERKPQKYPMVNYLDPKANKSFSYYNASKGV